MTTGHLSFGAQSKPRMYWYLLVTGTCSVVVGGLRMKSVGVTFGVPL